jgi:uncharacterized lipoprotein YmbA
MPPLRASLLGAGLLCAGLLCAGLLTGCLSGTPPSNHYLLTALAREVPEGSSPTIGVGPITIPEYLNRSGFVYLRQGNRVEVASFERWAEPLQKGIERVMTLNLSSLLDTQSVQAFPWPRSQAPDYAVKVNVLSLDANEARASLVAEWTLTEPGTGTTLQRRISRLEQPLGGAFSSALIAPAYSELIYQLSAEIATAIEQAGLDTSR